MTSGTAVFYVLLCHGATGFFPGCAFRFRMRGAEGTLTQRLGEPVAITHFRDPPLGAVEPLVQIASWEVAAGCLVASPSWLKDSPVSDQLHPMLLCKDSPQLPTDLRPELANLFREVHLHRDERDI